MVFLIGSSSSTASSFRGQSILKGTPTDSDEWTLIGVPYTECLSSVEQVPPCKASTPKPQKSRAVLKKRRTSAEDPRARVRSAERQQTTRPSTASGTVVYPQSSLRGETPRTMRYPRSWPHHSLSIDSLWLSRPTRPLSVPKAPSSPNTLCPTSDSLKIPTDITSSTADGLSQGIGAHDCPLTQVVPRSPTTIGFGLALSSGCEKISYETVSSLDIGMLLGSFETTTRWPADISRPRSRTISIATSVSVYSQESYSHTLQGIPRESDDEADSRSMNTVILPRGFRQCSNDVMEDSGTEQMFSAHHPRVEQPFGWNGGITTDSSASRNTTSSVDDNFSQASYSSASTPPTSASCMMSNPNLHSGASSSRCSFSHGSQTYDFECSATSSILCNESRGGNSMTEDIYSNCDTAQDNRTWLEDDICTDYDYVAAVEVLVYGSAVCLGLATQVSSGIVRQTSVRSRRESDLRRRQSIDKIVMGSKSAFKKLKSRKMGKVKGKEMREKLSAEEDARERRPILFNVTHFFGRT